MKLLYLSNALIPSRQANSIHIMKMCSAFCENGFNVSLICRQGSNIRIPSDSNKIFKFYGTKNIFKLIIFNSSNSLISQYLFAIKSLLVCIYIRPKIVVSRFLLAGFLSSLFFNTIIELHQIPSKKSRIQKYLLTIIRYLPKFKGLIAITEPLKDLFIDEGFLSDSIHILPDGADISDLNPSKISFNPNRTNVNIGYAGHLYQGRGVELLFEIASLCPWITVHIAGGNEKDISHHKNIINIKNIKNIKIYGFMDPNKISNFYSNMDILAAPYQKKVHLESGNVTTEKWMSPLKVFEYMSSGKPIICSNIEVLKEVLNDKRNCILCDPENALEWINSIKLLIDNEDLAISISENAYNDLKTKYSWKNRAKRISDLILLKTYKN